MERLRLPDVSQLGRGGEGGCVWIALSTSITLRNEEQILILLPLDLRITTMYTYMPYGFGVFTRGGHRTAPWYSATGIMAAALVGTVTYILNQQDSFKAQSQGGEGEGEEGKENSCGPRMRCENDSGMGLKLQSRGSRSCEEGLLDRWYSQLTEVCGGDTGPSQTEAMTQPDGNRRI